MVEAMIFLTGRAASPYDTGEGVRMSNENKKASARIMRANGLSFRMIAVELDVSVGTVQRWCEKD